MQEARFGCTRRIARHPSAAIVAHPRKGEASNDGAKRMAPGATDPYGDCLISVGTLLLGLRAFLIALPSPPPAPSHRLFMSTARFLHGDQRWLIGAQP